MVVGGICRYQSYYVTNPTPPKKCQNCVRRNDKVFSSGSDRKMPTQAHQLILIKQLYRGSTAFLMSKYYWSELPPPIFCVCVCVDLRLNTFTYHFFSSHACGSNNGRACVLLFTIMLGPSAQPCTEALNNLILWWNSIWADWVKLNTNQAQVECWIWWFSPFCSLSCHVK